MTRQVIERKLLGTLTKIGQGGQGIVYRAPNVTTKFAASMVYKEYRPQFRAEVDFSALAAMPTLVEESHSYSYAEGQHLVSIAAWPCRIVEDAGTPTGFVMPAIPETFVTSLTTVKGVEPGLAEFQLLLNDASILRGLGIAIDDVQRYALLREAASALKFLHEHGVCVGDISPTNLLFSLASKTGIYFIDCDAMRVNGVSPLPQVETPGWEVPQGEEPGTVYSDAYKLGLLALRLLAGDQDTRSPQRIPSTTPHVLSRIITDTLEAQPHQRPLPEAWTHVLGYAIEEAEHQRSTAQSAPVVTQITSPAPVVRSRPTTPAPVGVASSVSTPPQKRAANQAVAAPAALKLAESSSREIWPFVIAGTIIAAVIAISVAAVAINNSHSRPPPTAPSLSATPSYNSDYASAQTPTPTPTALPFAQPPGLLQGPDESAPPDFRCSNNGFLLPNGWRVGPGVPNADGTYTSCALAINVGERYVATYSDPRTPLEVYAPGTRPCWEIQQSVPTVRCAGSDGSEFRMNCAPETQGTGEWITCRGGNEAVVYIF